MLTADEMLLEGTPPVLPLVAEDEDVVNDCDVTTTALLEPEDSLSFFDDFNRCLPLVSSFCDTMGAITVGGGDGGDGDRGRGATGRNRILVLTKASTPSSDSKKSTLTRLGVTIVRLGRR